jgi:hypothetical protein
MKERMVFVLLESRQLLPVAVFDQPQKPYLLPVDAECTQDNTRAVHHSHREIVATWTSESFGTVFFLIAYVVQSNRD